MPDHRVRQAIHRSRFHQLVSRSVQRGRITERHISARLAQGDVSATNEAGCSASEIKAISGHVSLREVKRYTKAADQVWATPSP